MHKEKLFLLGILVLLFLTFVSAESLSFYPKPKTSSGALQPNTAFNYTLNFTTSIDCTGVVINHTENVTTDESGVAFISVTVPDGMSAIPSFICEYRNGELRTVHNVSDGLFNDVYAQNGNFTNNVSADWFFGKFNISNAQPGDLRLGNYNIYFNETNNLLGGVPSSGGINFHQDIGEAKGGIWWDAYDQATDEIREVGWIVCHYNNSAGDVHSHCSWETLDNSTGTPSINTHFAIAYNGSQELTQVTFPSAYVKDVRLQDIYSVTGDNIVFKPDLDITFYPYGQTTIGLKILNSSSTIQLQGLGTDYIEVLDNLNVSSGKDTCIDGGNCLSNSVSSALANATYFKLDASNIPITGDVEIQKITPELDLYDTAGVGTHWYTRNTAGVLSWVREDVGSPVTMMSFTTGGYWSISGGLGLILQNANDLRFRDSDLKMWSSADGQIDIKSDDKILITAPNVTTTGNFTAGQKLITKGNIISNGSADFTLQELNATTPIANFTNVAYINNTQNFTAEQTFGENVTFEKTPIFQGNLMEFTQSSSKIKFGSGSGLAVLGYQLDTTSGTPAQIHYYNSTGSSLGYTQFSDTQGSIGVYLTGTTGYTFTSQSGNFIFDSTSGGNYIFDTTPSGYIDFGDISDGNFPKQTRLPSHNLTIMYDSNPAAFGITAAPAWTIATTTPGDADVLTNLTIRSDVSGKEVLELQHQGGIAMDNLPTGDTTATAMFVCWDNGELFLNETGCRT